MIGGRAAGSGVAGINDIIDNFDLLEEWEDRYRYLIELGRTLAPLPPEAHNEANKVRGCASQVWLETLPGRNAEGEPILTFRGDSDAHIVRGLVYIILAAFSGLPAREIAEADAQDIFARLDLSGHLTPQRSNGVRSMVERMRNDARTALASA